MFALSQGHTGQINLAACTAGLLDVQWTYTHNMVNSGASGFCLTVKQAGAAQTLTQGGCSATAKTDLWTFKNVTVAA